MNDSEMDKLLEQSFSGPRPRDAYRAQLLRDSTAVLGKGSGLQTYWRAAGLVAAGVLIAAVSFFCGRASSSATPVEQNRVAQQPPEAAQTVVVSADLVEWLKAARLFEQLGMEQRVTMAYKHAAKLVPSQAYTAGVQSQTVLVAQPGDKAELPCSGPYARDIQSILAQSLGE